MRAVFVCDDDGTLAGVVTRKTLVREVVAPGRASARDAAGRDRRGAALHDRLVLRLEEAFHFLEENDAERVPVVEDGRLVGVLCRCVLQRRLAEDEPPGEEDA